MDVYSVDFELVCDFLGSLRGCNETHHLPQHHVSFTSKAAHCWCLVAELRHLFSSFGRMERGGKIFEIN